MLRVLFRTIASFTKITPQAIPKLKAQFQNDLSVKSLGQYYSPQNLEQLYQIIIETKMNPHQSNQALNGLVEICPAQSDSQLNVLVNILKQKAINNTRLNNIPSAIQEFQQAISTILLMEHPNELALSQIYKFIGDLYIQINELKKAQKSLKLAESNLLNLKQSNEQEQKYINSGLACIYTQLAMIYYRERKPLNAAQELEKAFNCWQKVPRKFLQEYELTCRLKCMLHILFKQNGQVLQAAKNFIDFMRNSAEYLKNPNSRFIEMTKLYYLNIICSFQERHQQEQAEIIAILNKLKKQVGDERLLQTMAMVGIKEDRYAL